MPNLYPEPPLTVHHRYVCICGKDVSLEPLDNLVTAYVTEKRDIYNVWWHKSCFITTVKEN